MLAVQSRYQLKNQLPGAGVEIAGGLIRQQDLWLSNEGARQRQALLLTTGKFARSMMPAFGESYLAQPAGRLVLG